MHTGKEYFINIQAASR